MSDLFISPVDATLSTLTGQSYEFKAGVPTYVSPQSQPFALAAGYVSADAPVEVPAVEAPVDPAV